MTDRDTDKKYMEMAVRLAAKGMGRVSPNPMVGAVKGTAYRTNRLGRFGYITLKAKERQILGEQGACIKAHEFHYFDSTGNGEAFRAQKPLSDRGWDCIHADGQRVVGFPHLYYYSNPEMIARFLNVCKERGK